MTPPDHGTLGAAGAASRVASALRASMPAKRTRRASRFAASSSLTRRVVPITPHRAVAPPTPATHRHCEREREQRAFQTPTGGRPNGLHHPAHLGSVHRAHRLLLFPSLCGALFPVRWSFHPRVTNSDFLLHHREFHRSMPQPASRHRLPPCHCCAHQDTARRPSGCPRSVSDAAACRTNVRSRARQASGPQWRPRSTPSHSPPPRFMTHRHSPRRPRFHRHLPPPVGAAGHSADHRQPAPQ